jgi:hypothetical protein
LRSRSSNGRAGKDQLNAATCWAAIRVGQLLGPGPDKTGRPPKGTVRTRTVSKEDTQRFRLLARYRDELAGVIEAEMPKVGRLLRQARDLQRRDYGARRRWPLWPRGENRRGGQALLPT